MPKVKLVFITMNEDPELIGEAFRAGASAFLLKQGTAFELTDAIEKVLKGGSYVTSGAAKGLEEIALRDPRHQEHRPEPTHRQREVLQLLAEGYTMKEIGSILKITKRTVAAHKYAVMELLQLKPMQSSSIRCQAQYRLCLRRDLHRPRRRGKGGWLPRLGVYPRMLHILPKFCWCRCLVRPTRA